MEAHFYAMGSPCAIRTLSEGAAAVAACEAATTEVRRLESKYSRYDPDSELSKLNMICRSGGKVEVDAETSLLIDRAFDAFRISDGLFDVTSGVLREIWNDDVRELPDERRLAAVLARIGMGRLEWRAPTLSFGVRDMELDLGGIVKEYAADRAASILRDAGERGGFVCLGGDFAILGAQDDGTPWRIGIADPTNPERAVATVFASSGGLATSGLYERYWTIAGKRYGHVFDPVRGWPVDSGVASVTVADRTCLSAGLLATIGVLRGDLGPRWLEDIGASYVVIDRAGATHGSLLSGERQSDQVPTPFERNCDIN